MIKFSSTTVVTPNNEIISLFDLDKKVKNWPSFAKMRHKLSYLTCLPEISSVLFEVNTVDYFPKLLTLKSKFKPRLQSKLGEGGQAKVFKGEFHGKDVAMKYVPLDHVKKNYEFDVWSFGCHEFDQQEKVLY